MKIYDAGHAFIMWGFYTLGCAFIGLLVLVGLIFVVGWCADRWRSRKASGRPTPSAAIPPSITNSNKMNTTIAPAPTAKPTDFADLVSLLEKLTEVSNDLAALEAQLNGDHLANVRLHTDRYKALQTQIGEIQAAIQVIAERNPQWYEKKKSVETPYGLVKRTSSTKLVIPDEQVSVTLIAAAGRAADFLVTTTSIRKEVIELLGDDELKKFGISRVTTHNFNPEPATVDLGKAVKAAEKSDKAAAKTARKARED